jgi:hypothetical protein
MPEFEKNAVKWLSLLSAHRRDASAFCFNCERCLDGSYRLSGNSRLNLEIMRSKRKR